MRNTVMADLPDLRIRPDWTPPPVQEAPVLSYHVLTIGSEHGYEEIKPFIPIYEELLKYHDERNDEISLDNRLQWHIAIACQPTSRVWGIYDHRRPVGVVMAQVQELYYHKRLFVHGYYLRKGYHFGRLGRQLEHEMYQWAIEHGASVAEFETNRAPSAWNRRSGYKIPRGFFL